MTLTPFTHDAHPSTERAGARYVVQFSGGIASYLAARRIVDRHGPESVQLLFCDTLIEDEDLYRFLIEAAADVFGVQRDRVAPLAKSAAGIPKIEDGTLTSARPDCRE